VQLPNVILTFAGDESGDPSFSFGRGASSHFVFAMIATADPDILRACLDRVRRERGLPAYFEFSYHGLTSARLRESVFAALGQEQFSAWVIVVDKQTLPDYFRSGGGRQFYAFFVSELIRLIPGEKREGALLILDQFDPVGRALNELKRTLKHRGIRRGFAKMVNARSRSEALVQAADLVAGAVLRSVTRGDTATYKQIQDKLQLLHTYQP
jgi:hypothetical protein